MMEAVAIPPFERFYEQHRTEVLRLLRRRLGADRAEDAFQETFLRALRAYRRLEHGEHLRAWVLTIAHNVALDMLRRARPTTELVDTGAEDVRPAYEDLAEMHSRGKVVIGMQTVETGARLDWYRSEKARDLRDRYADDRGAKTESMAGGTANPS